MASVAPAGSYMDGGKAPTEAAIALANRASQLLMRIASDSEISDHWDSRRALVDSHLVGHEPPAELFANVVRRRSTIEVEMTLRDLIGYIRSWSCYATYCKLTGVAKYSEQDPVEKYQREFIKIYSSSSGSPSTTSTVSNNEDVLATTILVSYPVFLMLGTKRHET